MWVGSCIHKAGSSISSGFLRRLGGWYLLQAGACKNPMKSVLHMVLLVSWIGGYKKMESVFPMSGGSQNILM